VKAIFSQLFHVINERELMVRGTPELSYDTVMLHAVGK
jgi:hypothetical protein